MRLAPTLAALAALLLALPCASRASTTAVLREGAPGYPGTRDVSIDYQLYDYWDPDGNYDLSCSGCTTELAVDGAPVDIAALLRFDLSGIPAGATVTAVDLIVRVTNTTSSSYPIYELR